MLPAKMTLTTKSIAGNSPIHQRFKIYAALMTFVYPVGIPLALGWWLFRHRVDLRADEVGRRNNSRITPAADLWGPYRPERYYYEASVLSSLLP